MPTDVLAARMRHLTEQFLAGLGVDLAAIAADPVQAPALIHRIAGRAGTFGFPAISEVASQLETIIAVEGPSSPAYALGLMALFGAAGSAHSATTSRPSVDHE